MGFILLILGGLLILAFVYKDKLEHILLLNKILDLSQDGYWLYYPKSDESWWSPQNYQLLGLKNRRQHKDKNFFPSLIHPKYVERFEKATEQDNYELIVQVKHSNGKYLWIQTSGIKYTVPFLKKEVVIGFNRNVSDLYEIAHEVKYLAYHDRATDTLNSEGFKRKLHELTTIPVDTSTSYVLMVDLGLSHYKKEMNSFSTSEVVQFVVNHLKKTFGHDKTARISEHQFAILSYEKNQYDLHEYFKQLNQLLINGVSLEETTYYGSIRTFALEMFPIEHYEQYLIYRDYAVQHLIEDVEDPFILFDAKTKAKCLESMQIRNDFMLGLKQNEGILYFQPIINAKTNKICKMEALIRWNHPSKGILGPGAFLPYLNVGHDI